LKDAKESKNISNRTKGPRKEAIAGGKGGRYNFEARSHSTGC